MPEFTSLAEIIRLATLPVLWLVILTAIGLLFIQRIAPEMALIGKIGLGYGLSLGIFTLLTSLASLIGMALNRSLFLGLTGILFVVSLAIFFLWRTGEVFFRK